MSCQCVECGRRQEEEMLPQGPRITSHNLEHRSVWKRDRGLASSTSIVCMDVVLIYQSPCSSGICISPVQDTLHTSPLEGLTLVAPSGSRSCGLISSFPSLCTI
ncbi:uncharacterized protein LOC123503093 [Portunus trituberculatus]|uniref:uncharacterized protein LOC123503093 n=1 Tax=Portunus trituberculatus TaxID=210409 RepID=UPI001E1CFCF9|nr:uncharacterized protein LOC123503093 [Portunus trituberculatus]